MVGGPLGRRRGRRGLGGSGVYAVRRANGRGGRESARGLRPCSAALAGRPAGTAAICCGGFAGGWTCWWAASGMRRGRRDPDTLLSGDPLDFWRVVAEPDRRLTLNAEMKMPGRAWAAVRRRAGERTETGPRPTDRALQSSGPAGVGLLGVDAAGARSHLQGHAACHRRAGRLPAPPAATGSGRDRRTPHTRRVRRAASGPPAPSAR